MKELKTSNHNLIIETHYPLAKRNQFTKSWVIAESSTRFRQKRLQNSAVEVAYHRVIDAVKRLYLKPSEVYYDRDYKRDKTENCLAMHSFITPTFYWYLECDYYYDYQIQYEFNNCPFESQIVALLRQYPLDRQATKISLKPDFKTFYATVLKVQDAKHLYHL